MAMQRQKLKRFFHPLRQLIVLFHPLLRHRLWMLVSLFVTTLALSMGLHLGWLAPSVMAQPNPQIGLVSNFAPGTVAPGADSTYRLTFRNSTSNPVTIISLSQTLPNTPGAVVISGPVTTNTCGSTVSLTPGSFPGTPGSYTITGGTIPPVGECIIEFPARAFVAGNHIDTIPAGALSTNAGTTTESTSATLRVLPSTPATIAKSSSPNTIPGDGRFIVTITINNPNSYPLTGATLQDLLTGSGYNVDQRVGAPLPATTCGAGTVVITPGVDGGVTLNNGTVPASGSCTITYPATGSVATTYTNTIPANALTTTNLISNSNVASTTMNVQTNITINKAFGVGTLAESNETTLTLTINNGSGPLTGVNLTDFLPAPVVIAPVPLASTTCVGGIVTAVAGSGSVSISGADVPGANPTTNTQGSCAITVRVRIAPGVIGDIPSSITNTIPVGALTSDQGRSNNNSPSANLNLQPALVLDKTYLDFSGNEDREIAPGSNSRLRITIRNRSTTITATGVSFTDNLPSPLVVANPPGETYASCGGGSFGPLGSGGQTTLNFSGGTITPGATCTIEVNVTIPPATPVGINLDNIIPNNSVGNGQGFDSNGVTGTEGRITVVSRVAVTKSFAPNPQRRGLPARLTIRIENNRRNAGGAAENLTGINITDPLPLNLQVATPANPNNTCGGTFTATPASTSISLVGGSIPPTSFCLLEVDVIEIDRSFANFPTPRNYVNTTGVLESNEEPDIPGATATLQIISPLFASKSFQADRIAANGISTTTITLRNTDPVPLTNVSFTDTWTQLNTVIVQPPIPNASAPSTTCPGTPVITVLGPRSIQVTGITLNPQVGGVPFVCTVNFDVRMDGTGPATFNNVIPPGGLTSAEGFSNGEPIEATLTRVVVAVSLNKSISPVGVVAGDPSTLQVEINNPAAGGVPLSNLSLTDNMPAGMVVFGTTGGQTINGTSTCGGVVTGISGTNTFNLTGATLPPGGNCVVTIRVTLTVTGNRTNTIPAGTITSKEGVSNTDAAAASLNALPTFTITKAFSPSTITAPPNISTVTLTLRNNQTSTELTNPISNISVTDTLPVPMLIATPPGITTTCAGATSTMVGGETALTATGIQLLPGASCTFSANIVVGPAGSYANQVAAGEVTGELQVGGTITNLNPSNTATLTVNQTALPPNVLLVKRITALNTTSFTTLNNDPGDPNDDNINWPAGFLQGELTLNNVRPGDEIEYTVYFINVGQGPGQAVRVCDRILPNQTYIPNTYNGQTPTDGGVGTDYGIRLTIGSTTVFLSNVNDPPDRGEFFAAPIVPPACNITTNDTGAIAVNVTRTAAPAFPQLPNATGSGTPANASGAIRFRTRVN